MKISMKIMLKKFTATVGCLFAAFVLITGGMTDTVKASQDFNSDARSGVAVVYSAFYDENNVEHMSGWGTGFFVGSTKDDAEYIVTNYHVIETYIVYGKGERVSVSTEDGEVIIGRTVIKIYFDSDNYIEAYPVEYDETKDLAVLRLEKPISLRHALKICVLEKETIGQELWVIGYPGLSENIFVKRTTSWGSDDVTVTKGVVSGFPGRSGAGVSLIQTDAVIIQGNSGGPMVNADGDVIGISSMYVYGDKETTYYGVNVKDLVPLLVRNGIPYEEASSDNMVKLIIMIAAAVTVIILIVALVVLLRKNKKKRVVEKPGIAGESAEQGGSGNAAVKKPAVRSLSAQHHGAVYSVKDRILIGRDHAACMVVFREGTPGVSGSHCSLSYRAAANDFILTDLGSTYGTFLSDGQRLSPNTPYYLKAGDSFYLGEKANILRVELL